MLTHIVNFSILRRKLLQIAGKGPSLSPVLTVPVLPRLAPVKTSQYTVINRGTFPCSHSHGVAPVLPRQAGVTRLYYLFLTSLTVKPGCIKNFNHITVKAPRLTPATVALRFYSGSSRLPPPPPPPSSGLRPFIKTGRTGELK